MKTGAIALCGGVLALLLLNACSSSEGGGNSEVRAGVSADQPSLVDPGDESTPPQHGSADEAPPPDAPDIPEEPMPPLSEEPACQSRYAVPVVTAVLQDERLTGVSGVVASRKNPGILWVHNDYRGAPTLFAVEAATGRTLGLLVAPGGEALNPEDVALARCPSALDGEEEVADCLWLADSGNNARTRADLKIFALPEPDLPPAEEASDEGAPALWTAAALWTFPFRYPQESLDSEAFAVEPDGSAFYLLEKVDAERARLFEARAPFEEGVEIELQTVGAIEAPRFFISIPLGLMMTGADLHPTRRRFALRTYLGSFEYRFQTEDWPRELLTTVPITVSWGPLDEIQGESVAYDASGFHLWTIAEDPQQQPGQAIHAYLCQDAGAER